MSVTPRSNATKYASRNPVVQRLLGRYRDTLTRLVSDAHPATVLDVGAGEGFTAAHLTAILPDVDYLGVELDAHAVADARARCPAATFEVGDVFALGDRRAELVICLEVLEHLHDPARAVDALRDACTARVIVSVPWEPWFRLGNLARANHLRGLGNHPEHIQAFSPRTLRHLLARRFDDVQVHGALPWVFATGVAR